MKIVDDFFTSHDIDLFRQLCQKQLGADNLISYQVAAGHYNPNNEITGTENSYLSRIQERARHMFLKRLVDLDIAKPEVMTSGKMTDLFYLTAKSPYEGTWHRDRTNNDWQEPDTIGLILFLNTSWNDRDGGLYFYRTDDDPNIVFVSPQCNRLVYNSRDFSHGVTPLTNPAVTRLSCQIFVDRSLLR